MKYINDHNVAWLSVKKETVEVGYWKGEMPAPHNLALIRFLRENESVIQVVSSESKNGIEEIDACSLKTRGNLLRRSPLTIQNLEVEALNSPPLCTAEQLLKFEEFTKSRTH